MSFRGGKCDGERLQKCLYLSPAITNPQPNLAACIRKSHSHMHELHANSHILTYTSWRCSETLVLMHIQLGHQLSFNPILLWVLVTLTSQMMLLWVITPMNVFQPPCSIYQTEGLEDWSVCNIYVLSYRNFGMCLIPCKLSLSVSHTCCFGSCKPNLEI